MMSGSEDQVWCEGGGGRVRGLGQLLERVANDLTPQHDSRHYQSGFIPSATPPWTTATGQTTPLTSLGSPLQAPHPTLTAQCGLQPPNHNNLGSQVPSMQPVQQSTHGNIRPKLTPMQPATTTTTSSVVPGPLPPPPSGSQISSGGVGSNVRSYSVSQDLFGELDGSRSPLFRSSSDLGLRLSHYQGSQLGSSGDSRLDGFMDSSLDSLDGMIVGRHDSSGGGANTAAGGYFLEVQRRPNAAPGTPPLQQPDPQQQHNIGPSTQIQHQQQQQQQQEFSFYSRENERVQQTGGDPATTRSNTNISAKFSNIITTSLGSWFSPFDPFRSNLTATQTKTTDTQASSLGITGTESATLRSEHNKGSTKSMGGEVQTPPLTHHLHKTNRPSYSAVVSKNPVQEGQKVAGGGGGGAGAGSAHATTNRGSHSISSSSSSVTSNSLQLQQSPSPSPATNRPDKKTRTNQSLNKVSKSQSPAGGTGNLSSSSRQKSAGSSGGVDSHGPCLSSSRVGLDEFDLSDGSLSNGVLSAYEHYDWGESSGVNVCSSPTSSSSSGSTKNSSSVANQHQHQGKWSGKGSASDVKKNTPEKVVKSHSSHPTEAPVTGKSTKNNNNNNNHLNNKVTSMHQKQPPKRTPYINNNLGSATTTATTACPPTQSGGVSGSSSNNNNTSAFHQTYTGTNNSNNPFSTISPNRHGRSSTPTSAATSNTHNNSSSNTCDHDRSDTGRHRNTQQQLPKEERRTQENVNGNVPSGSARSSGRVRQQTLKNSSNKELRRPPRRRKDNSFAHSELVNQGWAACVQWAGLMVRALMWLCTLTTDVAVMSTRLSLHLLAVSWIHLQEYWGLLKISLRHYWTRLYSFLTRKNKEEKKLPGRDRKVSGGLDCNISLPTTGEEAMKRLLACKGKDPYSILGLTRDCTDDDIKKYYKRQAFLVHPDKNKQPGAEEAFKILAHAFEIIGEPERRKEYDVRLAEEVKLEGAWGELASLLTRLQEKLDEAANTIRCTNCNKRHRRVKVSRPIYAARDCAECKIHHAAREGDIWAESSMLGLRWRYYACMEGAVYDISDWAACQSDNLKHLQANTHSVQYRIVSGKKNPPSKNTTPEFPSDPDLEEFFSNLCKEKFGKNYSSGSGPGSGGGGQQMPDTRKRRGKKKK